MPLRIGLAGTGRIGRVHAENLAYRLPSVQLAGLAATRSLHEGRRVKISEID